MAALDPRVQILANARLIYGPDVEIFVVAHDEIYPSYQAIIADRYPVHGKWTKYVHTRDAGDAIEAVSLLYEKLSFQLGRVLVNNGNSIPFTGNISQVLDLHVDWQVQMREESDSGRTSPSDYIRVDTPVSNVSGRSSHELTAEEVGRLDQTVSNTSKSFRYFPTKEEISHDTDEGVIAQPSNSPTHDSDSIKPSRSFPAKEQEEIRELKNLWNGVCEQANRGPTEEIADAKPFPKRESEVAETEPIFEFEADVSPAAIIPSHKPDIRTFASNDTTRRCSKCSTGKQCGFCRKFERLQNDLRYAEQFRSWMEPKFGFPEVEAATINSQPVGTAIPEVESTSKAENSTPVPPIERDPSKNCGTCTKSSLCRNCMMVELEHNAIHAETIPGSPADAVAIYDVERVQMSTVKTILTAKASTNTPYTVKHDCSVPILGRVPGACSMCTESKTCQKCTKAEQSKQDDSSSENSRVDTMSSMAARRERSWSPLSPWGQPCNSGKQSSILLKQFDEAVANTAGATHLVSTVVGTAAEAKAAVIKEGTQTVSVTEKAVEYDDWDLPLKKTRKRMKLADIIERKFKVAAENERRAVLIEKSIERKLAPMNSIDEWSRMPLQKENVTNNSANLAPSCLPAEKSILEDTLTCSEPEPASVDTEVLPVKQKEDKDAPAKCPEDTALNHTQDLVAEVNVLWKTFAEQIAKKKMAKKKKVCEQYAGTYEPQVESTAFEPKTTADPKEWELGATKLDLIKESEMKWVPINSNFGLEPLSHREASVKKANVKSSTDGVAGQAQLDFESAFGIQDDILESYRNTSPKAKTKNAAVPEAASGKPSVLRKGIYEDDDDSDSPYFLKLATAVSPTVVEESVTGSNHDWGSWGVPQNKKNKKATTVVPTVVEEPVTEPNDEWASWGTSKKKTAKKTAVTEPVIDTHDDWSNWGKSKKSKNITIVTPALAEEPVTESNDDWGSWGISKEKSENTNAIVPIVVEQTVTKPKDDWGSWGTSTKKATETTSIFEPVMDNQLAQGFSPIKNPVPGSVARPVNHDAHWNSSSRKWEIANGRTGQFTDASHMSQAEAKAVSTSDVPHEFYWTSADYPMIGNIHGEGREPQLGDATRRNWSLAINSWSNTKSKRDSIHHLTEQNLKNLRILETAREAKQEQASKTSVMAECDPSEDLFVRLGNSRQTESKMLDAISLRDGKQEEKRVVEGTVYVFSEETAVQYPEYIPVRGDAGALSIKDLEKTIEAPKLRPDGIESSFKSEKMILDKTPTWTSWEPNKKDKRKNLIQVSLEHSSTPAPPTNLPGLNTFFFNIIFTLDPDHDRTDTPSKQLQTFLPITHYSKSEIYASVHDYLGSRIANWHVESIGLEYYFGKKINLYGDGEIGIEDELPVKEWMKMWMKGVIPGVRVVVLRALVEVKGELFVSQ